MQSAKKNKEKKEWREKYKKTKCAIRLKDALFRIAQLNSILFFVGNWTPAHIGKVSENNYMYSHQLGFMLFLNISTSLK